MASDKKQDYLWLEMKSRHKLCGEYDHFLTTWPGLTPLECLLEQVSHGDPVEVKITVLSMTDAELEKFCEEKEIAWGGDY